MAFEIFANMADSMFGNVFDTERTNNQNRYNRNTANEMFDRQMAYNDRMLDTQVYRKVADMRRAGLNPAFENGSQLGASPLGVSPSSPTASAFPSRSLGMAEGSLMATQRENIEQDTQNKKQDEIRQKIENEYLPQLKSNEVHLLGSNIDLNATQMHLNEEEARGIAQNIAESENRIAKMVSEMNVLRKQVDIMDEEYKIKQIEALWKNEEIKATIANLQASAHLSETQAKDIVNTFAERMLNMKSQTAVNNQQNSLIYWNAQSGKLQFNLDNQYSSYERANGLIQSGCMTAETVGRVLEEAIQNGAMYHQAWNDPLTRNPYAGKGQGLVQAVIGKAKKKAQMNGSKPSRRAPRRR